MDGVFLISHAHDDDALVTALGLVRSAFPESFLGVNVIGRSPAESLERLSAGSVAHHVDALWTDSAGRDIRDVEVRARAFAEAKAAASWHGVQFGGVAFKYQPPVDRGTLAELATCAAQQVDVVTTSGSGTGIAIDLEKLATMRDALGTRPLAVASGVTAENVRDLRDRVQHILVSTGIKGEDGAFDVQRIEQLRRATL